MSTKPPQVESFGAAPHERPVPRISIHAFCEYPDTGAALQRAGGDRRLSKAHLQVQLGGVNAAIDHYNGQITPNLLIVETKLNGADALNELDRLAEVCDPATKVVVVGRVNDVELYRELMRRGASEYLVAPLEPLQPPLPLPQLPEPQVQAPLPGAEPASAARYASPCCRAASLPSPAASLPHPCARSGT